MPSPAPLTRRAFLPAGLALGGLALHPGAASAAGAAAMPAGLTTAPASQAGASPRLTMHAIDIHHGTPGALMRVDLSRADGESSDRWTLLKRFDTNRGGRTDEPLLVGEAWRPGRYEVLLHVDDYFARSGDALPQPAFLSKVPLRFVVRDAAERIHLAILFTPWSYSYYRGS